MPLSHLALFYETDDEYAVRLSEFVCAGVDAGESVLVSVPERRHRLLRDALDGRGESVAIVDMCELGRNPSRIIPAIEAFLEAGSKKAWFVGEPIWPGRTDDELVEGVRHEALLNLAFAGRELTILCPYDAAGLPDAVLGDAARTHPFRLDRGGVAGCPGYADPLAVWSAADRPLAAPDGPTIALPLDDLASFRRELRGFALPLLVGSVRVDDLAVAACEAATNALQHAGRAGARAWRGPAELVCEISSDGLIDDPLAGRRAPAPSAGRGRGLWLVNQLCDLVELRSDAAGTVIRLHMTLA